MKFILLWDRDGEAVGAANEGALLVDTAPVLHEQRAVMGVFVCPRLVAHRLSEGRILARHHDERGPNGLRLHLKDVETPMAALGAAARASKRVGVALHRVREVGVNAAPESHEMIVRHEETVTAKVGWTQADVSREAGSSV